MKKLMLANALIGAALLCGGSAAAQQYGADSMYEDPLNPTVETRRVKNPRVGSGNDFENRDADQMRGQYHWEDSRSTVPRQSEASDIPPPHLNLDKNPPRGSTYGSPARKIDSSRPEPSGKRMPEGTTPRDPS